MSKQVVMKPFSFLVFLHNNQTTDQPQPTLESVRWSASSFSSGIRQFNNLVNAIGSNGDDYYFHCYLTKANWMVLDKPQLVLIDRSNKGCL